MTSTIVSDRASVIAALSRRAAEILARHGYPAKPLTGDIDLGMLPIADMAALASSSGPKSTDDLVRKAQATRDALKDLYFAAAEEGSPLEAAILAGAEAIKGLLGLVSPTPDGVIKERGEDKEVERALRDGLSQVEPASGLNPSDFDPSRVALLLWLNDFPADRAGMFNFISQAERQNYEGQAIRLLQRAGIRARDQRAEREDAQRPRPEAASPVRNAEAPASTVQPPSSQESGVGNPRPALRDMTDAELLAESASMDQRLAAFRADMDECGGRSGSPGESLYEAADALDIEIQRRGLVPSAPRPSQREG